MLLRSAGSRIFSTIGVALLLVDAFGVARAAASAPLFNEVHTIAAPTTGVPQEYTFNVDAAGTYTVTLTDLGAALTPSAPLASVKLAVTGNDVLVGLPLVGAGALNVNLPASGTYELHVIGMPGTGLGSGPFGIDVTKGATQLAAFQGTLALPSQGLPSGEAVLDGSFAVSNSGSYTVTLTDLQLPQSLTTLTLLLIAQGGATAVVTLPNSGSLQATVALTAGVTYDIFAVGQANATANAGLYSAVVAPSGGGAPVFSQVVPVGNTISVGSPALAAGNGTFRLTDLSYPAVLSQLGAVLTLNGQVVVQLGAAGSQPFTATAGTYEAFAVGTAPMAAPGAGTYAVQVLPASGPALFGVARAVTAAGSTLSAYSFDTTISTAGAYTASLTDFQFPLVLSSLSLAAVQGGALLGTPINSAGNSNIHAVEGPLSLIVFTQAGAAGGLFGIDVTPNAGSAVFDVTQGVGALFTAQQISVTASGSYSVTATDLGFPANFASYDTIVTQGTSHLGSIFGGGTFNFTATAGNYFVNFIAQPSGSDQAGTYALSVASAPAAPSVTLSVDRPQVTSGSTVDIVWSTQNATACTGSGGWSGSQALSGTITSAALTANTTFTLSCTGPGGSTSKSVNVTVSAPSGGGGGGAADLELLLALAAALGVRCRKLGLRRA